MVTLFFACCLMVSLLSPAFAVESDIYPYIGITAGSALTSVRTLSDSSGSLYPVFNPGYIAGVEAGIAYNTNPGLNIDRIRVEAEAGYRTSKLVRMRNAGGHDADMSGTVTVKNLMLNGYLDNTGLTFNDLPVHLFVTAGVGVAAATNSTVSYQGTTIVPSANDTQLAYQGGAGFGYELTNKIIFDATYKYLGTTPFRFADVKADYGSHSILLGARYSFK